MKKATKGEYLSILFLFCLIAKIESQSSCIVNGIDLSPLTITNGNYYTAINPVYGDTFYWNICGEVSNTYCTSDPGTSVCQRSGSSYFSCGLYSTQDFTLNLNETITASYSGGDVCTGISGQPRRSTQIQLICTNDVVPVVSVIDEYLCTFTLQMKTMYACSTPPSPSPSPSPTQYYAGYNPCNSVKVKTIPSVLSNNLSNGRAYNSDCSEGPSQYSQFFYYIPSSNGEISASTCGRTSMDSIINVYSSSDCESLGECIASNDDGCADPTKTQSTVSLDVVAGTSYYFEVRTYGNSPPAAYSISFDST